MHHNTVKFLALFSSYMPEFSFHSLHCLAKNIAADYLRQIPTEMESADVTGKACEIHKK